MNEWGIVCDQMPDKDSKGPRKRSYRPSKKKGGRQLGDEIGNNR